METRSKQDREGENTFTFLNTNESLHHTHDANSYSIRNPKQSSQLLSQIFSLRSTLAALTQAAKIPGHPLGKKGRDQQAVLSHSTSPARSRYGLILGRNFLSLVEINQHGPPHDLFPLCAPKNPTKGHNKCRYSAIEFPNDNSNTTSNLNYV